jgi:hypothetical protein
MRGSGIPSNNPTITREVPETVVGRDGRGEAKMKPGDKINLHYHRQ